MRPSYFLFSLFGTLAAAHAKGVGSNAATDANKGVTPEYELHCGPFTEGCRSFCGCTKDGKLARLDSKYAFMIHSKDFLAFVRG
ncbi:hypothetical protein MGG_17250 [Pyricularia oryzae 70-15]|uniref:Uncharacterized protein n=3 Tax=Pyricularia oryzae TaxID=318829 RepID=G4N9K2_PYRO7|nr:uncharacterized protein MGG_17250 [Pyricularia oryzae 70-15]EHA51190.1 hypothetical protein MGG_17250 [Pyricularia oryzae 70-15]ELQ35668.1 hypothetical protein OOU_Y34scaffold00694g4 [Pyricularia oryzae Y34]